jgi:hypothetical protein
MWCLGQKGNVGTFLRGRDKSLRLDWPVGSVTGCRRSALKCPKKLQFTMQALLVTKIYGIVYQGGEYGLFFGSIMVRIGVKVEVRVSGFCGKLYGPWKHWVYGR